MACVKIEAMVFLMMGLCCVCFGAVYRVGDSAGWTNLGNVDYTRWATNKSFHVGDTLLFEYNKSFHNVLQVRQRDYESCTTSSPIATHSSGNDSITLKQPGQFYFICGFPGHCQAGQKVAVHVIGGPAPSTSPQLGSPSPAPFKNGAPLLHSFKFPSAFTGLLVFCVPVFVY